MSIDTLLAAPFFLLNNDSVHARVYLIDEDGWESMTPITVDPDQTAIINQAIPDYVTGKLSFGQLKED